MVESVPAAPYCAAQKKQPLGIPIMSRESSTIPGKLRRGRKSFSRRITMNAKSSTAARKKRVPARRKGGMLATPILTAIENDPQIRVIKANPTPVRAFQTLRVGADAVCRGVSLFSIVIVPIIITDRTAIRQEQFVPLLQVMLRQVGEDWYVIVERLVRSGLSMLSTLPVFARLRLVMALLSWPIE